MQMPGYDNHHIFKRARLKVLEESKGKCSFCDEDAFIVHHKDGSNHNHDESNLIALCVSCHTKMHHTAKRVVWDVGMIEYGLMKKGMDKKELAEEMGCDQATISVILKKGKTKNSTMKKIAEILEMPLISFIKQV